MDDLRESYSTTFKRPVLIYKENKKLRRIQAGFNRQKAVPILLKEDKKFLPESEIFFFI
ncbi:MAG: hypothetical protein ABIQ74_09425 [Chitinophagales bacterium]